jgi:uncharacterized protein
VLGQLHDREEELAALVDLARRAAAGRAQLVVVSGHRRVGKTYLLHHLLGRLNGHRTAMHSATEQSEAVELQRFAATVAPAFPDEPFLARGSTMADWEQALTGIADAARRRPVTLVIDEAPYLSRSTPGFASIVQTVWDRIAVTADPVHLLLVLTGSAAGVMDQMVGPGGPLRGRVSRHLRLRPFDLPTVHRILGTSPVATIEAYAACGGWPLHVAAWDPVVDTATNVLRLAGQPGGLLLEDADLILRELPDAPGFGRVLAAIGRGRTRYNDIAIDADQRIEYPLAFLVDSGLVTRGTPVGAPRRARPHYAIVDPYLRFWFTVLYSDRARIEGGLGRAVLQAREGLWRHHVAWVFEEAARAHAQRLLSASEAGRETLVGRWWGQGRQPEEVDVLGLRDGRTVLIGEAKWSAGPFDRRWLAELDRKLTLVPEPVADPLRWMWTRAQLTGTPPGLTVYGPADLLG